MPYCRRHNSPKRTMLFSLSISELFSVNVECFWQNISPYVFLMTTSTWGMENNNNNNNRREKGEHRANDLWSSSSVCTEIRSVHYNTNDAVVFTIRPVHVKQIYLEYCVGRSLISRRSEPITKGETDCGKSANIISMIKMNIFVVFFCCSFLFFALFFILSQRFIQYFGTNNNDVPYFDCNSIRFTIQMKFSS